MLDLIFGNYSNMVGWALILMVIVGVWEFIWKAIALWGAARNTQKVWYIFILLFNTAGILPIIYILFFQKKKGRK